MEASPSLVERHVVGSLVKAVMLRDRRRPPAPAPEHIASRDVTLDGNTGAQLSARWFPAGRSKGVVVLAHPDKRAAKHWFVKSGWVDFLHQHDYDVLTFDFTGYGASRGPATYYHEDLLAAARLAQDWSGFLPVHVVGVSMGAFAAANASPKLSFAKSLTLESPYPSFNAWYPRGFQKSFMNGFDRAFPASSRAIQADRNIANAAPERILVALAEQDEVTRPELSEAIFHAAPAERSRLVRLKGKHFSAIDDEAFREALLKTLGP